MNLQVFGSSNTYSRERQIKRRGIECSIEDFSRDYQFLEGGTYEVFHPKKENFKDTLTLTRTLQVY